jgi:uncharacterized membrane protein
MSPHSPPAGFRSHTNVLVELFIATLVLLPFLVLIYCYPSLPDRIPEYLNLNGEVAVWGPKSWFSVFRLPLMALDLQVLAMFMKYGLWQKYAMQPQQPSETLASKSLRLLDGAVEWLRAMVAIKLFVSSIEVIFLTDDKFKSLATATRAASWISSILGVIGAGVCLYAMFKLRRKLPAAGDRPNQSPDPGHVHGGIFYYNSADPSLFADKYLFNFANKWLYVFFVCLLCMPLLMFLPMLNS